MPDHGKLSRVIRGSVRDTINAHPEYLTEQGKAAIAGSLEKRLIGQIASLLEREGAATPPE